MKRTPLFSAHEKLGGRLIEFGGWEMPVQYTSIMDEHQCVRNAAGIFDISHMGEVLVKGTAAAEFLNALLTNDLRKLSPGSGQYTLMCNELGGVIDDLYAYQLTDQEYLLIINASRIEPDVEWLQRRHQAFTRKQEVALENASDRFGAVAVQGPKVASFIDASFPAVRPTSLKKNQLLRARFRDAEVLVARTGYTGEDGFEIIAPSDQIEAVWNDILEKGRGAGIKPAGLGARDTLRTEVCYPLYGHELDENTTPIEAGVGFFVALDKGEFVGRAVLAAQKAEGPARRCVAFRMAEKSAPPRPQYPIWSPEGQRLGDVVSGTQSPSLGVGIGMGYVPSVHAKAGTAIEIEIRGKRYRAEIAAKPLYRRA
jgi:aminomethyltransferase